MRILLTLDRVSEGKIKLTLKQTALNTQLIHKCK